MTCSAELGLEVIGHTGIITLNRPKVLHALSVDSCQAAAAALDNWQAEPAIERVIIRAMPDAASPRPVFCAGGDIRSAANLLAEGLDQGRSYFSAEYPLHCRIAAFPKPLVTLADGLAMGAGAGLLVHAGFPVASQRLDLAMPETAIGLFPDVGASQFLNRCIGAAGMYMGLTGARIGAADALAFGLVPMIAEAADFDALLEALLALPASRDISHARNLTADCLAGFRTDPGPPLLGPAATWINSRFSLQSVEAIRDSLADDEHPLAAAAHKALTARSPTSLKLTLRLLNLGKAEPVSAVSAIIQDYHIAWRLMELPDFAEGVRALLVDKDQQPAWQPAKLEAVEENLLDVLLEPVEGLVLALPDWVEEQP